MRLAILQRVCPAYRLGLFQHLAKTPDLDLRLFIGEDLPDSKVRSVPDLQDLDHVRLPTRFLRVGGRVLFDHQGLNKKLREFQPDVILCEGESNFLSYRKAIRYKRKHKNVALIHWSLGGLPGVAVNNKGLAARFKSINQANFDAFLVYSSYGKNCLAELGHAAAKIFVANNVTNTQRHLQNAAQLTESPQQARAELGLPDRFTVLYCGAMDSNKRPELLLDLARAGGPDHYNFVLLGKGDQLEALRARREAENLPHVFLPGHVGKQLPLYYRAASTMLLPGRGGMVISEAMAWSLPVIVHQADGTEYDLLHHQKTGLHLSQGDVPDFMAALESMRLAPERTAQMGQAGCQLLKADFSPDQVVAQILQAIAFVSKSARSESVLSRH